MWPISKNAFEIYCIQQVFDAKMKTRRRVATYHFRVTYSRQEEHKIQKTKADIC